MSQLIQRMCSMAVFASMLMKDNPSMKLHEAKRRSCIRKVKLSKHSPHYGKAAARRNLAHAKAGTHGLKMNLEGHVIFG